MTPLTSWKVRVCTITGPMSLSSAYIVYLHSLKQKESGGCRAALVFIQAAGRAHSDMQSLFLYSHWRENRQHAVGFVFCNPVS